MQPLINTVYDMFNLSVSCNKDPSNDWGAVPVAGSMAGPNSTGTGLLGKVVSGEYDISQSAWFMLYERFQWVDFHFR